jgi:hypothetical protein
MRRKVIAKLRQLDNQPTGSIEPDGLSADNTTP